MAIIPSQVEEAASRWGLADFAAPHLDRLAAYGNLLMRWNARISLTSIRSELEVIERHLMEGVFAAAQHPPASSSLDFGSGTGVPGIPIAICHPEIRVILAESQRKKAAFLAEAVRELGLHATVHAARAESLQPAHFDAVWMRAVDQSATMLPIAASLVDPDGALCLFETKGADRIQVLGNWSQEEIPLPLSAGRVLHICRRA